MRMLDGSSQYVCSLHFLIIKWNMIPSFTPFIIIHAGVNPAETPRSLELIIRRFKDHSYKLLIMSFKPQEKPLIASE